MQEAGFRPMAPRAAGMEGRWASSDGVFVANFQGGSFTSLDARTNAVLAQGSYTATGGMVGMNWVSARTGQQHSASCTLIDPNNVRCEQAGASPFSLRRT